MSNGVVSAWSVSGAHLPEFVQTSICTLDSAVRASSRSTSSNSCGFPKSTSRNIPGDIGCQLDHRVAYELSKACCTSHRFGHALSRHCELRANSCPLRYIRNSAVDQNALPEAVCTARI